MRKLFLATTMTVLAVTVIGTTSAQALVARDGNTGQVCPEVEVDINEVYGGCLVEGMDGTWDLETSTTLYSTCTGSWDLRVDGTADYWAVNQDLSCGIFQRDACHDAGSALIPWPATHPSMPVCIENSTGTDHWVSTSWAFTFGPNGEVLEQNQINTPEGFRDGSFDNTGATNEVLVTVN